MVKLFFYGSQQSDTMDTSLKVVATNQMEILIEIFDAENDRDCNIKLDRQTAIRFHRELKKQIAAIAPPSDVNVWDEPNKI
jgi:hypothetical protein